MGIGVALIIIGLVMLAIGYQHTNPFTCETQGVPNCFANSNDISWGTYVIGWGVPVEIAGAALVALGLGWAMVAQLGRRES